MLETCDKSSNEAIIASENLQILLIDSVIIIPTINLKLDQLILYRMLNPWDYIVKHFTKTSGGFKI